MNTADVIHCHISTSKMPTSWSDIDMESNVKYEPLCDFLKTNFSAPSIDIYQYPSQQMISNDMDLQMSFEDAKSNNNSHLYLSLSFPEHNHQPAEQISYFQPFPIGPNVQKVLEHYGIHNYKGATTASEIIDLFPLPKGHVQTLGAFGSDRQIFFNQRVKRLAEMCGVSYEKLLREVKELYKMGKQEQEQSSAGSQYYAPSSQTTPQNYHGKNCNNCFKPLVGIRYKCIMCLDFDLCEECEAKNMNLFFHNDSHFFIKIIRPDTFSWKTVYLHQTQNLPPGACAAVKNLCRPSQPLQRAQPSVEQLEARLQYLQKKLHEAKQQEAMNDAPPLAGSGQSQGFFPSLSNMWKRV